jgi:hypothetical protein
LRHHGRVAHAVTCAAHLCLSFECPHRRPHRRTKAAQRLARPAVLRYRRPSRRRRCVPGRCACMPLTT